MFIVYDERINVDCAVTFPTRKAAMEWLESKSISNPKVARPVMDSNNIHWM